MARLSPGQMAQLACVLEATARKPGNVHRFADFDDCSYLDFILSAAEIAGPLDRARRVGLGRSVLEAVEATRRVTLTNTNLGMVLLLTPLAMLGPREGPSDVSRVLSGTTVEDARLVYRAIRLARPGGLGRVDDQDVEAEPTATLLETMRLAEHRDAVARQYARDFADVREVMPALREHVRQEWPLETAVVWTFLDLLRLRPDTLIERKRGPGVAAEASHRAGRILLLGWPTAGHQEMADLDAWLRADGHARNPGATADLVSAALFLALRDGTIPLPLATGPAAWSGTRRPPFAVE
jgi:triphosphoribosyl-dephospho-CoA synthase